LSFTPRQQDIKWGREMRRKEQHEIWQISNGAGNSALFSEAKLILDSHVVARVTGEHVT